MWMAKTCGFLLSCCLLQPNGVGVVLSQLLGTQTEGNHASWLIILNIIYIYNLQLVFVRHDD